MLAEPSCRALSQLLELTDTVVVAAEETRKGCLWIGADWAIPVDAVKAADLLFVAFEPVSNHTRVNKMRRWALTPSQGRELGKYPRAN